jgi:hypothetical protein
MRTETKSILAELARKRALKAPALQLRDYWRTGMLCKAWLIAFVLERRDGGRSAMALVGYGDPLQIGILVSAVLDTVRAVNRRYRELVEFLGERGSL